MKNLVKITINNKEYSVPEHTKVLKACEDIGIKIPTFCDDKRLIPTGACRMCVVEIGTERRSKLQTSCSTEVKEGMIIKTETEKVANARKTILKLLWASHPNECPTCEKSGECKLQDYSFEYGVDIDDISNIQEHRGIPINKDAKFYSIDSNKCISCNKCVRICSQLQCNDALGLNNRGPHTIIERASFKGDTNCTECGACVHVCPVGSLMPKSKEKFRNWQIKKTQTTCSYCGVGCQLNLVTKNNKVVRVDPVMDSINNGLYCVKGIFAYNFINHKDRLTTPLIRKDGKLTECSWEEAYEVIDFNRKKTLAEKGGAGFAGLSSARTTNEDNYLFQKMVRVGFETNSVDHCARL